MVVKVICKETQKLHEITVRNNGENSMPCPNCSPSRKKPNDKCMNFNASKGQGRCWNDGCTFYEYKEQEIEQTYTIPEWTNYTNLNDAQLKEFQRRMIGAKTLNDLGISNKDGKVAFPFYKEGQVVNVKYRAKGKKFSVEKGAELTWYNYDAIKANEEIIIVEGEIDLASFVQEGIANVISIPNGVNSLGACMDLEIFEHVKKFYLAVDTDKAGLELRDKLLEVLGSERCLVCSFGENKDANAFLMAKGYNSLQGVLDNAVYMRSEATKKLDNLLDGAKLDPTQKIEKPPVIFSIRELMQENTEREVGIFSLGDLSLLQGLQKSKKTFLNSGIMASMLNNKVHAKFIPNLPSDRKRVAFFDTEQSDYYGQMTNARIYKSSGSLEFDYFCLRSMNSTQRRELIQRYLQRTPECSFIVIDGIVDCMEDFNDITQSKELVQWLMTLTNKHYIHALNVLHENFGDSQKARGHLGSFLAQKAETVIRIEKKLGEDSKSTISAKDTRGREFKSFDLGINDNGEVYFENLTQVGVNPLSTYQSQLDLPSNRGFKELITDHPF